MRNNGADIALRAARNAGVVQGTRRFDVVVGSHLNLYEKPGDRVGDVEEALRQPVGSKADAFGDLEQAILHAHRFGSKRLDNGRVELERQVEPGHRRNEGELFAGKVAAQPAGLQHVVQFFGELSDLRVVGRIGTAGGANI